MPAKSPNLLLPLVLFALLVLVSCAPKAPPTAPVAPTPAVPATPGVPTITPEEAAWAKVVAEAKKEGRVTPYTFSLTGDIGRAVARAFEDRYGIKVELVTGVGAVLLERIKGEAAAAKYIADTYDTAVTFVAVAKGDGLTQPVADLPILRQKDVWTRHPQLDPEGHIQASGVGALTPYVNNNLVKPGEEPKSLLEMLEPKWKGKIATAAPAADPLLVWFLLMGKRHNFLDEDYFRKLARQDLKIAGTVRDADALAIRGEASVRLPGANTVINTAIKQGAPVRPAVMEEGTILIASRPLALLKNAPHPNAAKVFINWMLSQEGQRVYHGAGGTPSVRKDVPDFSPPQGQFTPKKALVSDMELELEVGRVQRAKVLDKLLGLE